MVTSPDSLQVLVPVYHLILLLLASLAPLIQLLIRKGGRERGKEGGEGRGERERTTERGREERRREKELKGELLQVRTCVHAYHYKGSHLSWRRVPGSLLHHSHIMLLHSCKVESEQHSPECKPTQNDVLPYSRKYWWSLNLAVCHQTECNKILTKFKFGGGVLQCVMSSSLLPSFG